MKIINTIIVATVSWVCLTACTPVTRQPDYFSSGELSAWKAHTFAKPTIYKLVTLKGETVLEASSVNAASALYQPVQIDLHNTPYVNWKWKISDALGEINELKKTGDDFAARIYIVLSPKLFHLKPRSLNYVWSSNQPIGTSWRSPYSKDVVMLAVQSGNQRAGGWIVEKRNVRDDLLHYFGEGIRYIEGIAVMTDTDNSGLSVVTHYGDIYFSKN